MDEKNQVVFIGKRYSADLNLEVSHSLYMSASFGQPLNACLKYGSNLMIFQVSVEATDTFLRDYDGPPYCSCSVDSLGHICEEEWFYKVTEGRGTFSVGDDVDLVVSGDNGERRLHMNIEDVITNEKLQNGEFPELKMRILSENPFERQSEEGKSVVTLEEQYEDNLNMLKNSLG